MRLIIFLAVLGALIGGAVAAASVSAPLALALGLGIPVWVVIGGLWVLRGAWIKAVDGGPDRNDDDMPDMEYRYSSRDPVWRRAHGVPTEKSIIDWRRS